MAFQIKSEIFDFFWIFLHFFAKFDIPFTILFARPKKAATLVAIGSCGLKHGKAG